MADFFNRIGRFLPLAKGDSRPIVDKCSKQTERIAAGCFIQKPSFARVSAFYRRTSPASACKCGRAIHSYDSANNVTSCAVFLVRPRKHTLARTCALTLPSACPRLSRPCPGQENLKHGYLREWIRDHTGLYPFEQLEYVDCSEPCPLAGTDQQTLQYMGALA
jgi:hypothetical protein